MLQRYITRPFEVSAMVYTERNSDDIMSTFQSEIISMDYKNCVVGIDLWYPEKDARDVPVYDCYVTSINVDPDGWGEKPAQEDIIFCGGLKLGAPREEVATLLKSTHTDESGKVTYEYYTNKDEFSESFTVWVDSTEHVLHLSIAVRDYVR